ncbi:MAG: DUF3298 domain-containing protein [Clostridiales bacterium]|mgnify:FL=1|nr:DUF3298 domain-containing protein [Clostridiales bacterium]
MVRKDRGAAAPGVYERTFLADGEKILSVRITYPLAGWDCENRGLKRIEKFYKKIFGSFQKYCQNRLRAEAEQDRKTCLEQGIKFKPYHASLCHSVTYYSDGILSIFYDRREEKDSTQRFLARYSETWHTRSGKLFEMKDFFGGGRHWKKDVIAAVSAAAEYAVAEGNDVLYPDYAKLIPRYFSARRFYLTSRGVAVFFQPCTLGPPEEGVPVFEIPLTEPVTDEEEETIL